MNDLKYMENCLNKLKRNIENQIKSKCTKNMDKLKIELSNNFDENQCNILENLRLVLNPRKHPTNLILATVG